MYAAILFIIGGPYKYSRARMQETVRNSEMETRGLQYYKSIQVLVCSDDISMIGDRSTVKEVRFKSL
jgi:hypothetical protein